MKSRGVFAEDSFAQKGEIKSKLNAKPDIKDQTLALINAINRYWEFCHFLEKRPRIKSNPLCWVQTKAFFDTENRRLEAKIGFFGVFLI